MCKYSDVAAVVKEMEGMTNGQWQDLCEVAEVFLSSGVAHDFPTLKRRAHTILGVEVARLVKEEQAQ